MGHFLTQPFSWRSLAEWLSQKIIHNNDDDDDDDDDDF